MAAQHSVARVGAAPVTARPSVFKSSQRILGRDWPIAWLFFLPSALLLGGLVAYPLASAVWTSLHIAVGPRLGAFVGLDNYIDLWTDDDQFRSSVWQTVRFTFFSVSTLKMLLDLRIASTRS